MPPTSVAPYNSTSLQPKRSSNSGAQPGNGTIGHLKYNLLHHTCDSLSEHLRTLDRYTTLAAQENVANGRKVSAVNLVAEPVWTFLRTYFLQAGFLDGYEGFIIANMAAAYTFLKYAKARNMS